LLDIALDLFSRKGYEGTTTKEIAATAGITEALVFRHFPSKQALYAAVMDSHTEAGGGVEWFEQIKYYMDRDDDAAVFREIARKIVACYRNDLPFERLTLFAALEGHEQGIARFRAFAVPVFEVLCEYIQRRQAAGALQGYDPGLILGAAAGMAQYFGMMTRMFGFDSHLSDEEVVETFTGILLAGIRAPGQPEQKNDR